MFDSQYSYNSMKKSNMKYYNATFSNNNNPDENFFLNNSLDIICITTIDGYITYSTPCCKEILGYDSKEIVNKCIFKFIHPNHIKVFKNDLKDMIINNTEKKIRLLFQTAFNDYIWLEGLYKSLYNNDTLCGIIFSLRDINNQIKYEKVLNKNHQELKLLIDLMPYGAYIFKNTNLYYSNSTGLSYLGVKNLYSILNKHIYDFIVPHPNDKISFQNNIKSLLTKGTLKPIEQQFIRKDDGKTLYLEIWGIKFPCDENNSLIVIARDIQERKIARDLSKKIEEKNKLLTKTIEYDKLRAEFFANISHELRTPINVIYSALQLLNLELNNQIDNLENTVLCKRIDIIKQNCFRLMRLINNLIDTTKIDAGYYKLNLTNCNIVNIIENITLSVAEYVENKGINLIFDTNIEEKIMCCDIDKMERIMLNLISNASKFTNSGGTINVTIKDKNNYILISVKDNGIGIPKDKCKIIFKRFMQTGKFLKGEKEGSGIGLSLVNSLVKMHSGSIEVESELNKGSEFIIKLPYKVLPESKTSKPLNNSMMLNNKIKTIELELSDIYL